MFYGRFVEPVEIGAGAFGTVYQALDPKAGRYVALKESACGKSNSACVRIEGMKQEYELIKKLHHENIVTVFDFFAADDGYVVISMELASGGSLRELLRKTKFRLFESTVRHYAMGALRGLEYLHNKGVLHCDIKPENIVLSGSMVKLCDFGLSKQCVGSSADGHHTQNISGTPRYMAPELWDTNTYTQASDIWALGCTLAELASGNRPWDGSIKPDSHHYAIMFFVHGLLANPGAYDATKVVPGHLTKSFRELLTQMLTLDPSKRPSATQCLQASYFLEGDSWRDDEGMEAEDSYDALLVGVHSTPTVTKEFDVTPSISRADVSSSQNDNNTTMMAPRRTSASSGESGSPASPDGNRKLTSATREKKVSVVARPVAELTRSRHPTQTRAAVIAPKATQDAPVWLFQNGRTPVAYEVQVQRDIEAAFQEKRPVFIVHCIRILDGKECSYEIDFDKMTQRNMKTNYRRKVMRRTDDA
ncbi:protein kinase, putative [Bodo saltans]|uniref:Protein kinase, putative n=1 Tax=Bodo saltans TaxID=75058 RepID=A0A0S4JU73_BODSA|nr:protein kinase, putative [Bodo saltans]|eukprot:CUG93839.1 protein kinase, putative [Bodo saltans]